MKLRYLPRQAANDQRLKGCKMCAKPDPVCGFAPILH